MTLEEDFDRHLHQIGEATKKHNYTPTYFIRMLEEYGGVETAKRLLQKSDAQQGLFTLWELGLLKESVEVAIISEKFTSSLHERRDFRSTKKVGRVRIFCKVTRF